MATTMLSKIWSRFCSSPLGSAGVRCRGIGCVPIDEAAFLSFWIEVTTLTFCIEHGLIAGAHAFFLILFLSVCLFKLNPLRHYIIGTSELRTRRTPFLCRVVACLALCLGLANLAVGGWQLLTNGWRSAPIHEWLVLLVQGLAYTVLAFTVRIWFAPPITTYLKTWWVASFILESIAGISIALDFLFLGEKFSHKHLLGFATWSVCFLLLICLFKKEEVNTVMGAYREPLLNGSRSKQDFDTADPLLDNVPSSTREDDYVTPFERSGIFSRLGFTWLNPLLSLGYSRVLDQSDLPRLGGADKAGAVYSQFKAVWEQQKLDSPSSSPSLLRVFAICHWRGLAWNGIYALFKSVTLSAGPLLLNLFIDFAAGKEAFKFEGYILVGGLFVAKMIESFSQRQWYFGSRRVGMHLRSALIAALYQKELLLSNTGRQRHAAGEVVNYMAVDAYRIGEFPYYVHFLWTTPLQIAVALVILFSTVGLGTLAGMGVIFAVTILNSPLAKAQQRQQTKLMSAQDARLRATTEALRNMRILKLQAWEDRFSEKIESFRQEEWKWLSAVQYRKAYNSMLFWISPIMIASATFLTAGALGTPLTASGVFTALATLRIIQEPIRLVPDLIAVLIQFRVSTNRVARFLEEDEIQVDAVERLPKTNVHAAIEIRDGLLSWESNRDSKTLCNISVCVQHGDRVAVVGEVGAGKSSLLCAIVGEIPRLSGVVKVSGSIAYVPQTPWIQSGTVRDNILFGLPMDNSRYQASIQACALDKDIESFTFGDLTEIGERGINMSGGQKQRIQLARAVYQDADIYLLDDPFSAVDAHTATSLFTDCVMGILATKTVILVTHQVEFLPAVDLILVHKVLIHFVARNFELSMYDSPGATFYIYQSQACLQLMRDGEICQKGSFDELLKSGSAFEDLVNAHKETMGVASVHDQNWNDGTRHKTAAATTEVVEQNFLSAKKTGRMANKLRMTNEDQLTKNEEKEVGSPGLKTYRDYLWQAGGHLYCVGLTASHIMFLLGQVASNWWMASKVENPDTTVSRLLGVYAVLGLGSGCFVFFRSVFVVWMGLVSSASFFSGIMNSVFRAPMGFFDSTPTGRILSRVSSDMSIIDLDLPFILGFAVGATLNASTTLIVTMAVTWQVAILILPVLCINRWLQRYYLASAREFMRINGTTKSPIVNHFGEAIAGSVTIRAFQVEERFKKINVELIDDNATAVFHAFAANEWLIQRLEALSTLILTASALLIVLLPSGRIDPGFVGLALTYGLSLNVSMVFSVQNQCTLDNNIISVERIKQFMSLPSEAPTVIESNRPPIQWPSNGKVELQNLQIRYRPRAPLVLRGVTCTFQGGQRVGIVGRTGSGKTTLISALFRLVEPAGGKILIDDLDITTIGLQDLRSRLSIIPQEPTLFRGTVRFNLDPLEQYPDPDIWEALDKCQLGDVIRERAEGLDSPVGDDGENWSVGQRQLFCLGRVLLRRSRILVLDEATASIDNATDSILQKIIRKEFCDCTVITVAHRIPTVVDSDMVLALHDGVLAEFDQPMKLLESTSSLFAKLVAEYWSHAQQASDSGHDSDLLSP